MGTIKWTFKIVSKAHMNNKIKKKGKKIIVSKDKLYLFLHILYVIMQTLAA
jgi:hypothetical protein